MAYRLDSTKEDGIYDFIKDIVGSSVNVIWDKPGEYRPEKPYVTISILNGPTKIGDRAEVRYKETDTWRYYFEKSFTLSIGTYANSNDIDLMNDIDNGLYLETKLDILRNVGLAVWTINGPFDMSTVIDDDWEYRYHLDVVMAYGEFVDDIPGEIHQVELNEILIDATED